MKVPLAFGLAVSGVGALLASPPPNAGEGDPRYGAGSSPRALEPHPVAEPVLPASPRVAAARRFAKQRDGEVSFAVVDTAGLLHGFHRIATAPSASLSKAMLFVAYLRAAERGALPLDASTRLTLAAMVRYSDNDAASTIYGLLGDGPVLELARRARMHRFVIAGNWAEARVTAADQARFFSRLEALVPESHRRFATRTLSEIAPEQSWGVPAAASDRWFVRFKGGWRPDASGFLVHQAALLTAGESRVAIAVLTQASPTFDYGVATVRGIAARLVGGR